MVVDNWFVFALASALCTAVAAVVQKRTLQDTHTIDFAVALSFVVGVVSIVILYFFPLHEMPLKLALGLVPLSGGAALGYFYATRAIRHLPISVSSPLLLLAPVVTTVLAYAVLGEALGTLHMLGIGVLVAGLYVFEARHLRNWREAAQSLFGSGFTRFALLAVFLYGCTSIFDRVALGWWKVPVIQYIALAQIGIALWMIVIARVLERRSLRDALSAVSGTWGFIILIVALTIAYRLLQSYAVVSAPVGMVSAVKHSSVFFAVLIGGRLFHEDALLRKTIGSAIMIAGLTILALS